MTPAQSHLLQAREHIAAGDHAKAMDLLKKAKMIVGTDEATKSSILRELVRIGDLGPAAPEQLAAWNAQLADINMRSVSRLSTPQPRPQRRSWRIPLAPTAVAVVVIVSAVGIGAWFFYRPKAAPNYKDSVYLVAAYDKRTKYVEPFGTGWTVERDSQGRRGVLATNAHVAEEVQAVLARRDSDVIPIARIPGDPPKDFEISGVRIHPGWPRWGTVFASELYGLDGSQLKLAPIYDVALLNVEGDVGAPLPLADSHELGRMKPQDTVYYIGYPMENMRGNLANATAMQQPGELTRICDPLMLRSDDQQKDVILELSTPVAGGASGSPIINGAGQVVGLVSAGHFAFVTSWEPKVRNGQVRYQEISTRISQGFTIGQRVDVLGEILSGRTIERGFHDLIQKRTMTGTGLARRMIEVRLARVRAVEKQEAEEKVKSGAQLTDDDLYWTTHEFVLASEFVSGTDGNKSTTNTKILRRDGGHTEFWRARRGTEYFIVAFADDFSPMSITLSYDGSVAIPRKEEPLSEGPFSPRTGGIIAMGREFKESEISEKEFQVEIHLRPTAASFSAEPLVNLCIFELRARK